MPLDDYFTGYEESHFIFNLLTQACPELRQAELGVTKTQVAFRRRVAFAWAWIPEKHLSRPAAPLVLSVRLRRRDVSGRWKQVVEPYPGRFIHHLELNNPGQVDDAISAWIREAWKEAA